MLVYLLLLFTLVPIAEIWILIQVGRVIDVGPTIALVLLTGVVGAALARREGLRALLRIQETVVQGRLPAAEVVEGVMIFLAGVMLVTPGILTDAVGFAILIPPVRTWLGRRLTAYFKRRIMIVHPGVDPAGPVRDDVIDVDFRDVTDESRPRRDDGRQGGHELT